MDISTRKYDQVHVIKLKGNFRLGRDVDEFREATETVMREGFAQLVVNLAEVHMMDSSAIGTLVRLMTSSKSRGGDVKLVAPSKLVAQTLKMVGLMNIFEVHADDAAAIAAFGGETKSASPQ